MALLKAARALDGLEGENERPDAGHPLCPARARFRPRSVRSSNEDDGLEGSSLSARCLKMTAAVSASTPRPNRVWRHVRRRHYRTRPRLVRTGALQDGCRHVAALMITTEDGRRRTARRKNSAAPAMPGGGHGRYGLLGFLSPSTAYGKGGSTEAPHTPFSLIPTPSQWPSSASRRALASV